MWLVHWFKWRDLVLYESPISKCCRSNCGTHLLFVKIGFVSAHRVIKSSRCRLKSVRNLWRSLWWFLVRRLICVFCEIAGHSHRMWLTVTFFSTSLQLCGFPTLAACWPICCSRLKGTFLEIRQSLRLLHLKLAKLLSVLNNSITLTVKGKY